MTEKEKEESVLTIRDYIQHDRIYGEFQLTDLVLIDLIYSQAVQRLHAVLQHGITALLDITRSTSRFEHSVGVMLLVRRLGASLLKQPSPALCADRLDYFLRDSMGEATRQPGSGFGAAAAAHPSSDLFY